MWIARRAPSVNFIERQFPSNLHPRQKYAFQRRAAANVLPRISGNIKREPLEFRHSGYEFLALASVTHETALTTLRAGSQLSARAVFSLTTLRA